MKEKHSIEFFLSNPDFVKWVNSSDEELGKYWLKFLAENPLSRNNFIQAREVIQSLQIAGKKPSGQIKQEVLNNIIKRIDEKNPPSQKKDSGSFWPKYLFRSAALITILFLVFISVYYFMEKITTGHDQTQITEKFIKKSPQGSKLTSKLPDGTIVWLNAETEIEYIELAEPKKRLVHLTGEAFFEVFHDSDRPFIVETNSCSVTALGTSFNVSSYSDNAFTSVALASGRVQVAHLDDHNQQVELRPGEKAVLMHDSSVFQVNPFDLEEEFGWREGILVFNKATYGEIKRQLERWFGVTITAEESIIGNWRVTARFENASLERILKHLSYTKKFEFTIENENVQINKINNQTMPMDKEPPDQ